MKADILLLGILFGLWMEMPFSYIILNIFFAIVCMQLFDLLLILLLVLQIPYQPCSPSKIIHPKSYRQLARLSELKKERDTLERRINQHSVSKYTKTLHENKLSRILKEIGNLDKKLRLDDALLKN